MNVLINLVLTLLAVLAASVAVSIAATNRRTLERVEDVQSRQIEAATANKKEADNRIDSVIRAENAWHEHIEDEIKNITDKMDAYAKDFGRLDEIDFRAREASAKASDVARCYMLNGSSETGGVKWASQYPTQEEEHE